MLTLAELIELKKQMIEEIEIIKSYIEQVDVAILVEKYGLLFDKEPKPVSDDRSFDLLMEAAV